MPESLLEDQANHDSIENTFSSLRTQNFKSNLEITSMIFCLMLTDSYLACGFLVIHLIWDSHRTCSAGSYEKFAFDFNYLTAMDCLCSLCKMFVSYVLKAYTWKLHGNATELRLYNIFHQICSFCQHLVFFLWGRKVAFLTSPCFLFF